MLKFKFATNNAAESDETNLDFAHRKIIIFVTSQAHNVNFSVGRNTV